MYAGNQWQSVNVIVIIVVVVVVVVFEAS